MPGLTVRVRRIKREIPEVVDGHATGNMITDPESLIVAFSYIDPDPKKRDSTTTFVADAHTDEFEMTPEQATSAVETGGFEVMESSKSPTEDQSDTQPLDGE